MPQRLGGVTRALGVGDELAYLRIGRGTGDCKRDCHLLEVRRRVVNIVFFGVLKGSTDVGGGVVNRDMIERREPRQLGKQSKGDANHQELEWRRPLLGPATGQRLIGVDVELAHPAFEMHIVENAGDRSRGDCALLSRRRRHLGAQALDLMHLLVEVDTSTLVRCLVRHGDGLHPVKSAPGSAPANKRLSGETATESSAGAAGVSS